MVGGAAIAGAAVLAGLAGGDEAADAYALFLGAIGMLWLVRRTRQASGAHLPSVYARAVAARGAPRPSRPATLERVEREVVLSSGSAFDLHVRLRRRLRAIAEHRLAAHRGLELDAGTAETRALLGDDLWELVRPDRPMPTDRLAPGLSIRRQRDLLDRVERI